MIAIISVSPEWLESFNNYFGFKEPFVHGKFVPVDDVSGNADYESLGLKRAVDKFNHVVAQGEAIRVQNKLF